MPQFPSCNRTTPEELTAELIRQIARVGVDLRAAHSRMFEVAPPVEVERPDGTIDVQITIDATGIVNTLRGLPDRAGTDAFVEAYNKPRGGPPARAS